MLTLVRNLVTGGVNQFLEEHIAEGDVLRGGLDAAQTAETRSRCKILQISLFDGPLAQYGVGPHEFSTLAKGFYHFTKNSRKYLLERKQNRNFPGISVGNLEVVLTDSWKIEYNFFHFQSPVKGKQ